MAYIGNTAASKFVSNRATSVYSGDGSTVAFTLEQVVAQDEDVLVSVDGVVQEPSVAYAVSSGTTLTFTAAPSNNAGNNIFVYYLASQAGTIGHPSTQGLTATTGTFSGNATVAGTLGVTGAVTLSTKLATTNLATGAVVQVKNVMDFNKVNGSTVMPEDDTIPQNNEGVEFLTLAITPTSATNKLKIEVHGFWNTQAQNWATMALFQDSTANALNAVTIIEIGSVNATVLTGTSLVHFMDAGTTSATTFKVRVGSKDAGNVTMNGVNDARKFGGVMGSGITITEIAV
jgi:hypothetical protein